MGSTDNPGRRSQLSLGSNTMQQKYCSSHKRKWDGALQGRPNPLGTFTGGRASCATPLNTNFTLHPLLATSPHYRIRMTKASMMDEYPYNLGSFKRTITTTSPEAQTWFDRGLTWAYSFNHKESAACFKQAIVHDESCMMAYWGCGLLSWSQLQSALGLPRQRVEIRCREHISSCMQSKTARRQCIACGAGSRKGNRCSLSE